MVYKRYASRVGYSKGHIQVFVSSVDYKFFNAKTNVGTL